MFWLFFSCILKYYLWEYAYSFESVEDIPLTFFLHGPHLPSPSFCYFCKFHVVFFFHFIHGRSHHNQSFSSQTLVLFSILCCCVWILNSILISISLGQIFMLPVLFLILGSFYICFHFSLVNGAYTYKHYRFFHILNYVISINS